jgi:hypothetical protein
MHFICEQDDIIYIYIISIKMAKTVAGKISGVLNWKSFFQPLKIRSNYYSTHTHSEDMIEKVCIFSFSGFSFSGF